MLHPYPPSCVWQLQSSRTCSSGSSVLCICVCVYAHSYVCINLCMYTHLDVEHDDIHCLFCVCTEVRMHLLIYVHLCVWRPWHSVIAVCHTCTCVHMLYIDISIVQHTLIHEPCATHANARVICNTREYMCGASHIYMRAYTTHMRDSLSHT